jgi:hypothetical protein
MDVSGKEKYFILDENRIANPRPFSPKSRHVSIELSLQVNPDVTE